MYQEIFPYKAGFDTEKFCFFRGPEGKDFMRKSERTEQVTTSKERTMSFIEEQARSASQSVHNVSKHILKNLQRTFAPLFQKTGEDSESKNQNIQINESQRNAFQIYTEGRSEVFHIYETSDTLEKERRVRNDQEKEIIEKESEILQKSFQIFFTEHPMPKSFSENGGTPEEWENLHPEVQEYEMYGGMAVPIDPMEIAVGGALKMANTTTAKGVFMIIDKGKAFLTGMAEELIPISRKETFDFVKKVKNKTEGWTKKITDFLEETFSPVGRTNEGVDMPTLQKATKQEMVAKDTLRRGPVAEHLIERADILARIHVFCCRIKFTFLEKEDLIME